MVFAYYYFEGHGSGTPVKQMLEGDYPYTAEEGTCQYDDSKGVGTVSTFDIPSFTSKSMKVALAKGPVAVAIKADADAFMLYESGVIAADDCGYVDETDLDHGVLAVGYDKDDSG